jgi:CheY-specific phosphatase CheX
MTTVNDWMNAVLAASEELAVSMLGFESADVIQMTEQLPKEGTAAHIALVGENVAAQVGIVTSAEHCQELARALMGMEEDEEDLQEDEVADAVSEMANIMAGQVKTRMAEANNIVNLGLPIFVRGELSFKEEGTELLAAEAKLGDIPVTFLVLLHDEGN